VSLERIGDMLLSQGDSSAALRLYRRSLEIGERLSAADPASADLARDVGISLTKIGDVLESQGDRDGALGLYRRALEIGERLSASDRASADLARRVFTAAFRVADLTGERRYWERALAILRDLEARGTLAEADRPFIVQIEGTLAGPVKPAN
jgi:tetratricopeptide (TPR) repeat protein